MNLKRELPLSGILFASISAIIGSGWLFGSLYAAQLAGPAAVLAWIIGGVAVIFVALCFAELATMFPLPGGLGIFPLFSHGETTSFSISWISWIAFVLITPIEIQAVIQYASNYIPNLMATVDGTQQLTSLGFVSAFALLVSLVLVNGISVKFMSDTNFFVTIWKLIVPIAVIIVFFCMASQWSNLTAHGGFAPYGAHGIFASLATGGIVLAFNGFQPGIALAGETKNPQKNIPIAVIGSVLICMIIYCLLQLSFLVAIPTEHLGESWKALKFAGEAGPLAGLAILIGIPLLAKILYADALVSPMGTAVVFFAAASRSSYAMSKCNYLPHFFQKTTRMGIPIWGVIANFIISAIIFLTFHGWQEMAEFYAAAICFSNAFIPLTLMALRARHPQIERPFKIPFPTVFAFLAFYISNLMYFWCGWETIYRLDITILIGIFFYAVLNPLLKSRVSKEKFQFSTMRQFVNFKATSIIFIYAVSFSVLSKLGSYGGGTNSIKTDTDYIIIGIVSLVIFALSKHNSLTRENSTVKINEYFDYKIEAEK